MGLRFRKSIKIAPGVKINLNKNSVSATVGSKGAHYTVNSKGKRTSTVGIPGTGLSYSTSSDGGKSKKSTKRNFPNNNIKTGTPSSKKKKGKGCLTVFIVLIILAGIGSAIGGDAEPTKITLSADTETVYDINTSIPITAKFEPSDAKLDNVTCEASGGDFINSDGKFSFIANEAGNYELRMKCSNVESNTLTFSIEDKEANRKAEEAEKQAELEAQKKAEEEVAAQAATESQVQQAPNADDPLVYITNTGDKYHNSTCRFLKDSKIEKHLSEVVGTYEPCKSCNPPQ